MTSPWRGARPGNRTNRRGRYGTDPPHRAERRTRTTWWPTATTPRGIDAGNTHGTGNSEGRKLDHLMPPPLWEQVQHVDL
ncbi:hypothetical protein [Streptomyces sp. NPDC093598]|uniref:hypothetical protein n=1 Tax=Streptomyces sp. NPDC093598 TaxID=3366046 RepID=UPI0037F47CBF